jgi:glycine betaine catabolism B
MKEHRVRLRERIVRAPGVESFRCEPVSKEKIDFLPGQFLQVMFNPAVPGDKLLNKYLSFSCAPGKGYIEFTKRLSQSDFSRQLQALSPGDELSVKAPLGTCVFEEGMRKIGFLIGGIGITPVISIVEHVASRGLPTDICLLYSNRTDEDIAFRRELDGWAAGNPRMRVSYLVSECPPKDNVCVFGVIDEQAVRRYICDIAQRTFFIYGPPRMVQAMQSLCVSLGCDPQAVKTENFVGY